MSDLEIRRVEATRRIMKALARLVAHDPLTVRLEDGSSPVVVALPDEPVADMVQRLQRAGGSANVVVDYVEHFTVAGFESGSLANFQSDDPAEVHNLATVGMLIDWLRLQPDSSGEFRVRGSSGASVVEAPSVQEHEYQF